jgi:hypothetical protein
MLYSQIHARLQGLFQLGVPRVARLLVEPPLGLPPVGEVQRHALRLIRLTTTRMLQRSVKCSLERFPWHAVAASSMDKSPANCLIMQDCVVACICERRNAHRLQRCVDEVLLTLVCPPTRAIWRQRAAAVR